MVSVIESASGSQAVIRPDGSQAIIASDIEALPASPGPTGGGPEILEAASKERSCSSCGCGGSVLRAVGNILKGIGRAIATVVGGMLYYSAKVVGILVACVFLIPMGVAWGTGVLIGGLIGCLWRSTDSIVQGAKIGGVVAVVCAQGIVSLPFWIIEGPLLLLSLAGKGLLKLGLGDRFGGQILWDDWGDIIDFGMRMLPNVLTRGTWLESEQGYRSMDSFSQLSPQAIRDKILRYSPEQRQEWLSSGDILQTLADLKIDYLDGDMYRDGDREILLSFRIDNVISDIPSKTLAAFACDYSSLALAYLNFVDDRELAVMIPLLPKEEFVEYCGSTPSPSLVKQASFLAYVTPEQEEYYWDKVDLRPEIVKKWEGGKRAGFLNSIRAFKEASSPSQEQLDVIQKNWEEYYRAAKFALDMDEKVIELFEKKFQQNGRTADLKIQLQTFREELLQFNSMIQEDRVRVEPPDEFLCPLSAELMTDPCTVRGYTYQRAAIERWIREDGRDPYTREDIALEDLEPNEEIKTRVKEFLRENSGFEFE